MTFRRRAAASIPRRLLVERFRVVLFCLRRGDVLESKQLERDYRVQKTFYETRLERDCQELHYPPPRTRPPPLPSTAAVMWGK